MRHKGLLRKAGQRMRNMHLSSAWNVWYELLLERRDKQAKQNK
jgi:hypothetical protein